MTGHPRALRIGKRIGLYLIIFVSESFRVNLLRKKRISATLPEKKIELKKEAKDPLESLREKSPGLLTDKIDLKRCRAARTGEFAEQASRTLPRTRGHDFKRQRCRSEG